MSFTARSFPAIRDALLSYWNARYLASNGIPLLTVAGSPAYMEAESVALIFAGSEQRGLSTVSEIFPDTASDESVLHHAAIDSIPRKPASAAVLTLQIAGGTPLAVVTFGTATPRTAAGVIYTPSASANGTGASITLDGAGAGTFYGTCQTLGTGGNLAVGTVLTWSSPPAGAPPTCTVSALATTAADVETIAALAQRVLERRRERPGGGNRADWRAWMEAVSGVAEGYVYPLLHPTLGVNTLGAITCVPLGLAPAPPFTGTTSRLLVAGDITHVSGYIDGTLDATGVAIANGKQLRPATMVAADVSIELPGTVTQNVLMPIVLGAGYAFPLAGPFTTAAGSTNTTINLTGAPTGVVAGMLFAVPDGSAAVRGGYTLCTVASTGATSIVFAAPGVVTAPGAALTVYPAPSNWAAMRDAILSVVDRLGPGDTSPISRYPTISEIGPTTLYRSALVAAVMGVPGLSGALAGVSGVVSATCTTPAADVVETPKQIVRVGTIVFTP